MKPIFLAFYEGKTHHRVNLNKIRSISQVQDHVSRSVLFRFDDGSDLLVHLPEGDAKIFEELVGPMDTDA